MKRFLTALALAGTAAATYVATAPGSLHAGPTARQFTALRRQVAALEKQVKALHKEADGEAALLLLCVVHQPVAVDRLGSATSGYLFGTPGTPPASATATSALDLAPSTETSPQYRVFALNTSSSACLNLVTAAGTLSAARAVAAFPAGG